MECHLIFQWESEHIIPTQLLTRTRMINHTLSNLSFLFCKIRGTHYCSLRSFPELILYALIFKRPKDL